MFDWDKWQEIIATAGKNRLRTFLTVFGVFWGMLMLVAMLGFGSGLENGVTTNMRGFATNAVYVWGRRASMPYKGMPPGRRVQFTNDDTDAIARNVRGIRYLAPRNQLGGHRDSANVTRNGETGSFQIMGDYPAMAHVQTVRFDRGRFINELDIKEKRKVAVIGKGVYDVLYKPGEDPIGTYIKAQGVYFQVIGMYRPRSSGEDADRAANTLHIPFTTFQQVFNYGNQVGWFAITGEDDVSGTELEKRVRQVLYERHKVNPEDDNALGSFNAQEEFQKIKTLFGGIQIFIWFVGVMTLLAGVIGVSNIMLIVVKERTKEIGIRKALGATPWSITSLILQESIVLTSLAGYLGLFAGVVLLEVVSAVVGSDSQMFANPQVDVNVALIGASVLVVSGALAGIIPARHAVRINPVEALRAE